MARMAVGYSETGVETFVVIQQGIVYERDLGPKRRRCAGAAVTNTPFQDPASIMPTPGLDN